MRLPGSEAEIEFKREVVARVVVPHLFAVARYFSIAEFSRGRQGCTHRHIQDFFTRAGLRKIVFRREGRRQGTQTEYALPTLRRHHP